MHKNCYEENDKIIKLIGGQYKKIWINEEIFMDG